MTVWLQSLKSFTKDSIFFEADSCLLALTTSTSHMQSCLKIDRGLIKLFNVEFQCLKVGVSLMTIMK